METPRRDVYLFRQTWLARFATFYGHEVFAEMAGRNPKHLSAIKSGSKPMGSRVARAIEEALIQRQPADRAVLDGLFDKDPDLYEDDIVGGIRLRATGRRVESPPAPSYAPELQLSARERALLENYRASSAEGKKALESASASLAESTSPPSPPQRRRKAS